MASCECLAGCPFFNDKMEMMPAMSNMYKKNFCLSDYSDCARFMVFKTLGKPSVPVDLFPNQKERAEQIIKKSKS